MFTILVSIAWHQIWNLRTDRVIATPDKALTVIEIHNKWLKAVNGALRRDCLLTEKIKFGPLALKKQLVLNTWSGILMDEDSLPDD
jgi:ribonuclease HI